MARIQSSENTGWISLREALERQGPSLGEDKALRQLVDRLSYHEIEARAAITIEEADIGPGYGFHAGSKYTPETLDGLLSETWIRECSIFEPYIAVGPIFFSKGQRWEIDIGSIDIDRGMILARRPGRFSMASRRMKLPEWDCEYEDEPRSPGRGLMRRVAIGLEFPASSFPEILQPVTAEPEESRQRIIGDPAKEGLNARRIDDSRVMAHFLDLVSAGKLRERIGDPAHPHFRKILIEQYAQELTNRNEDHDLSPSTLGRRADKIIKSYKKRYPEEFLTKDET